MYIRGTNEILRALLHKHKTSISILKVVLATASVYFIYVKVISRPDLDIILDNLKISLQQRNNAWIFAGILVLMFCNWMVEAVKWKLLLQRIQPVSFLKSFRSVLSGVTVSMFTPNRIGEFAGRVMHLDSDVRITASIASIIGSMNQLLITIMAGGLGLLASLNEYGLEDAVMYPLVFGSIVTCMAAIMLIYFRIPGISKITERIRMPGKIKLYTKVFGIYSFRDLSMLTILSCIRYLVFSFQFILMLQIFGITLSYIDFFRVIALTYLVMAMVPTVAISELTLRGSVALYFFSPLTANDGGVLAASSLLWMINLAMPALLGGLAVFYFRFTR